MGLFQGLIREREEFKLSVGWARNVPCGVEPRHQTCKFYPQILRHSERRKCDAVACLRMVEFTRRKIN